MNWMMYEPLQRASIYSAQVPNFNAKLANPRARSCIVTHLTTMWTSNIPLTCFPLALPLPHHTCGSHRRHSLHSPCLRHNLPHLAPLSHTMGDVEATERPTTLARTQHPPLISCCFLWQLSIKHNHICIQPYTLTTSLVVAPHPSSLHPYPLNSSLVMY